MQMKVPFTREHLMINESKTGKKKGTGYFFFFLIQYRDHMNSGFNICLTMILFLLSLIFSFSLLKRGLFIRLYGPSSAAVAGAKAGCDNNQSYTLSDKIYKSLFCFFV
jgi:hypothetical protein